MSVTETEFEPCASTLEAMFRTYHEWTKERTIKAFADGPIPTSEIDAAYDVDAVVAEDVEYLSDPSSARLFVARLDERIVGCAYLKPRSDEWAELKRLYVRPEARGVGLGRLLVETVVDAAIEDGYAALVLHTGPFTKAAQSLYTHLGFEPTEPFECEVPERAHEEWTFMRLEL